MQTVTLQGLSIQQMYSDSVFLKNWSYAAIPCQMAMMSCNGKPVTAGATKPLDIDEFATTFDHFSKPNVLQV